MPANVNLCHPRQLFGHPVGIEKKRVVKMLGVTYLDTPSHMYVMHVNVLSLIY